MTEKIRELKKDENSNQPKELTKDPKTLSKEYKKLVKTCNNRITDMIDEINEQVPQLSPILNNLNLVHKTSFETAGVSPNNEMFYNPYFISNLDDDNLKFVIIHESFHCILEHHVRFCEENNIDFDIYKNGKFNEIDEKTQEKLKNSGIWNVAADAVINENIIKSGITNDYLNGSIRMSMIAKELEVDEEKIENSSTEELYILLVKKRDELERQKDNEKITYSVGGTIENNDPNCNYRVKQIRKGACSYEEENNKIKEMLNEHNEEDKKEQDNEDNSTNSEENNNSNSKIGGSYIGDVNSKREQQIINDLLNNKKDSGKNWANLLLSLAEVNCKMKRSRSYKRPSRKYREIYPISKGKIRNKPRNSIVLAIDLSGSIDEELLKKEVRVISEIAEKVNVNFKYYFWASNYSEMFEYDNLKDFEKTLNECRVGGGTPFSNAIKHFEEYTKEGDLYVILSDLCFDYDSNPIEFFQKNKNVIYIDISEAHYDRTDYEGNERYIKIDKI